jgi:hypothetical protein
MANLTRYRCQLLDLVFDRIYYNGLMTGEFNNQEIPGYLIPAYTIRNGQSVQLDKIIFINPFGLFYGPESHFSILEFERLGKLIVCIDALAKRPGRYSTVTEGIAYHELYDIKRREIPHIDGPQDMESFACPMCGIFLPLRHIQTDHQRPQADGKIEAMAKIMRVLGLTTAGPHGKKCVQLQALSQKAVEEPSHDLIFSFMHRALWDASQIDHDRPERTPFQPVKPKDRHDAAQNTSTTQERYTLNMKGELFYSCIKAFRLEDLLFERAMHSLVNLRPLCGRCNSDRGNRCLKTPKISPGQEDENSHLPIPCIMDLKAIQENVEFGWRIEEWDGGNRYGEPLCKCAPKN